MMNMASRKMHAEQAHVRHDYQEKVSSCIIVVQKEKIWGAPKCCAGASK